MTSDDFCAFCFADLGGVAVVARQRRYCSTDHADADLRKRDAEHAVDEFQTAETAAEQLTLDES